MRRANISVGFVLGVSAAASAVPPVSGPQYEIRPVGGQFEGELFPMAMNESGSLAGHTGEHPRDAFVEAPADGLQMLSYPGFTGCEAAALSDSEVVAGVGYVVRGHTADYAPFRFSPETGFTLLRPLTNSYGEVTAINDHGDVVGQWADRTGTTWWYNRAYIYTDEGGFQWLGGIGTMTTGINNAGQVIGRSSARAVLWDAEGVHDLGTLGGQYSNTSDISEAGVVVGSAQDAQGAWQAFRYSAADGMTAIPMPGGVPSSQADFVNEHGQVAGTVTLADGSQKIFVYTPGQAAAKVLALPAGQSFVSIAGFNNSGALVASATPHGYGGESQALYFSAKTGLVDLRHRLANPDSVRMVSVSAINDAGVIAAHVTFDDFTRATVRLIPTRAGRSLQTPLQP